MTRRAFITFLGGAAAVWPLAARAQQSGKRATIGVLGSTTASLWTQWSATFAQRLHDLGWTEGRNLAIEYRWAEARWERASEIAAEFARLKVDVIVTAGAANVMAAKQATSVIPIVFALAPEPVGNGLVASLAQPGGNVTGLSVQSTGTVGKRLDLLREILPGLRRLGVWANVADPGAAAEISEIRAAATTLGLDISTLDVRSTQEIAPAFAALAPGLQALYVYGDPLASANQAQINTLALAARLPTTWPYSEPVETGGLMSYGTNFRDRFRRAAELVDKILRGAKPADIPVEQPTKFELVINLKTAKALGLTVPPTLTARADEVIE